MTELPDGWEVRPFGELNQFSSSTVDPSAQPDQAFELYSVPSFPAGKPEQLLGSAIGSTKQTVTPGDVLISKINPRINRVWTVGPKADNPQIASSEWIGFRSEAVQPAYANHYFKSPAFRDLLCSEVAGVGGSLTRAQPKRVAAYPVPVAPVAEQTRIAEQLDTLLARIKACNDHLNAIPGLLKRFRQAVLDAATLGDLTADWRDVNGSGPWTPLSLRDIAHVVGGVTKDSKKQSVADEEVPYLRVANVQRGYLDLTEVKTIRVPKAKLESLLLQPGDILFNEGGDLDKLGRGWIWEGQIPRCTFQNHVFRARLLDPRNEPKFISWWGNSRGLEYFIRSGKQTTNLASINKTMLEALPISLPSPEEQKEIVRCVEALFGIADRIEARYLAAKSQAHRLAPQSLAKAFRGELVPQDPNDEPASVLLARLAAERSQTSAAAKTRKARTSRTARSPQSTSSPSKAMPTKSRQDEDVKDQPYLAGHLRRLGQPVDAKTLFEASELPVADFYKQLAWEIAHGHVNDADPLLEPARHAA